MTEKFNIPRMMTINETAKATGLAKFYIRQLALLGKVQHVKAGKKFLINIDKLIEFLNGENTSENKEI